MSRDRFISDLMAHMAKIGYWVEGKTIIDDKLTLDFKQTRYDRAQVALRIVISERELDRLESCG